MTEIIDIATGIVGGVLANPIVGMVVDGILLSLVVLWIATAWWAWRDARARTRDPLVPYLAATGVVLATPFAFPLAAGVYRIVRRPTTVAAEEAAQLQVALLEEEVRRPLCGACGATLDEEWVACPACGETVAVRCGSCGRPLELDWTICAWCAADVPWAANGSPGPARRPVAIAMRPGGRPRLPVLAAPDGPERR